MSKKPKHFLCDCNEYKKNLSINVSWYTFLSFICFLTICSWVTFVYRLSKIDSMLVDDHAVHGSCVAEYRSMFLKPKENFCAINIYQFVEKFKQCKRFSSFFQRFTKLAEYLSIKHQLTPAIQNEMKSYGSYCYAEETIVPLLFLILMLHILQLFIYFYFLGCGFFRRLQWDYRALFRGARILTLIFWMLSLCELIAIRLLIEEYYFLFQ